MFRQNLPPNSNFRISSSAIRLISIVLLLAVMLNGIGVAPVAADPNWLLQFDGTTDMVVLHETADMMESGWETTKSIHFWVKPFAGNTCSGPDAASCDSIFGDLPRFWGISVGLITFGHHAGQDRIWVMNFDGTEDSIGIPYTSGEWAHIAMVHSDGELRGYKNGIFAGSIPSGATEQAQGSTPDLYLGGLLGSMPRFFEGQLDNVTIWNVALTATEISQHMYQTLPGDTPGLKAYYQMSDGVGLTLTDDSISSWDGTLLDGRPPGFPGNGTYPLWVEHEGFTPPSPPAAPTDLTASPIFNTHIDLAWIDQSDNEFSFEIERCQGTGCSDFSPLTTLLDNTQSYSDWDISPGIDYCYRVYASNSGGDSGYSNTACAMIRFLIFTPFMVQ